MHKVLISLIVIVTQLCKYLFPDCRNLLTDDHFSLSQKHLPLFLNLTQFVNNFLAFLEHLYGYSFFSRGPFSENWMYFMLLIRMFVNNLLKNRPVHPPLHRH